MGSLRMGYKLALDNVWVELKKVASVISFTNNNLMGPKLACIWQTTTYFNDKTTILGKSNPAHGRFQYATPNDIMSHVYE